MSNSHCPKSWPAEQAVPSSKGKSSGCTRSEFEMMTTKHSFSLQSIFKKR